MLLKSVNLINFRSLGEEDNLILIEPKITAIIGKNESGKTNVLAGLSHISFTNAMQTAFSSDNINRNKGTEAKIGYRITLVPTANDTAVFHLTSESSITIDKDSCTVSGSLQDYFQKKIRNVLDALLTSLGKNPFSLSASDLPAYRSHIQALQEIEVLDTRKINNALKYIQARLSAVTGDQKIKLEKAYNDVESSWTVFLQLMPQFFYRSTDKVLKAQYRLEEVQKELNQPAAASNSLLAALVKLIDVSPGDFITAVQGNPTPQRISIRSRISNKLKDLSDQFNLFYRAEPILLNAVFDSNIVHFTVSTGAGQTLSLSERSNGLRWYLNLFIDATVQGVSHSSTVYLLDEPGISLHVNAQKELIGFFRDLTDKGNQVVYTTHSPYMLDLEKADSHKIRAVDKDDEGFSHVYKTAYDARLSPENRQDTLAPIISALGMSLQHTFGPAQNKLNVVTEGPSDCIYLRTLARQLDVDLSRISFIPSTGASNVIHLCNILAGWNCKFIALFDYDKEGVESGGEDGVRIVGVN